MSNHIHGIRSSRPPRADGHVQVWEDPNKTTLLIDSGGGSYSARPSSFPTTVYVEGWSAGLATLFLEYTPDCQNPWYPVNEDSLQIAAVDVGFMWGDIHKAYHRFSINEDCEDCSAGSTVLAYLNQTLKPAADNYLEKAQAFQQAYPEDPENPVAQSACEDAQADLIAAYQGYTTLLQNLTIGNGSAEATISPGDLAFTLYETSGLTWANIPITISAHVDQWYSTSNSFSPAG